MPHITILDDYSGEWAGFYIDGQLVTEGHRIREDDVLDTLQKLGILTWESKEASTEDRFPQKLEDANFIEDPQP